MHFGRQLLRPLHVIECQHVGISDRRGLLKASKGHLQELVHAFHDLAQRPRIETDKNLARVGNCVRRKFDLVPHGGFQPAVENHTLLSAIGNDLDFANDDIGAAAFSVYLHLCGKR